MKIIIAHPVSLEFLSHSQLRRKGWAESRFPNGLYLMPSPQVAESSLGIWSSPQPYWFAPAEFEVSMVSKGALVSAWAPLQLSGQQRLQEMGVLWDAKASGHLFAADPRYGSPVCVETWSQASSQLTTLLLIPAGAAAEEWGWDPDFVNVLASRKNKKERKCNFLWKLTQAWFSVEKQRLW